MSSPDSMKSEKENTPLAPRYPQRNRSKVKYFEDFEMSMEEGSGSKKKSIVLEESVDDQIKPQSEDDLDSSKEESEEISEYEKLRLKNLEENRRIMIELGLIDPKKEEKKKKIVAARPKPKPIKKLAQPTPKGPVKRSLRLQRKTPDLQPLDLFQNSPVDSPNFREEKTRLDEEVLPMDEDGESSDFLDSLKSSLSQKLDTCSQESVEDLIKNMRNLEFATIERINTTRIQSMCIHPNEDKLLVISGSKNGELGFWNATDGKMAHFNPHLRAINCITVNPSNPSKLYSTSFDGTVRRADVNKSALEMVYQTDEKIRRCHLTWHSHVDDDTVLIAHGTGEVGVVDVRTKGVQRWYHCHPRSIRTIHQHPKEPHYFLTASGTGECKIWDLRGSKKHEDECIGEFSLPRDGRGLTSGFFSPDGTKALTTCNDDFLRIYDVSDLAHPAELNKIVHDNHTGQWLSVFKAIWHPHSSDLFIVGSMLQPRRIQMFSSSGQLVRELKDESMTTVSPVIAMHPSLPILVGGNSTGKGHVFTTPKLRLRYIKCDDDSDSDGVSS